MRAGRSTSTSSPPRLATVAVGECDARRRPGLGICGNGGGGRGRRGSLLSGGRGGPRPPDRRRARGRARARSSSGTSATARAPRALGAPRVPDHRAAPHQRDPPERGPDAHLARRRSTSRRTRAHRPRCAHYRLVAVRPIRRGSRATPSGVRGSVRFPDGSAAANRRIGLRAPDGRVVATARSDAGGAFLIRRALAQPGAWRVKLLDDLADSGPEVDRQPPVRASRCDRPPAPWAPGRRWWSAESSSRRQRASSSSSSSGPRAPGARSPKASRATTGGSRSPTRFRRTGAAYEVEMRVSAPRDRGWPHPTTSSRRFIVRVRG